METIIISKDQIDTLIAVIHVSTMSICFCLGMLSFETSAK